MDLVPQRLGKRGMRRAQCPSQNFLNCEHNLNCAYSCILHVFKWLKVNQQQGRCVNLSPKTPRVGSGPCRISPHLDSWPSVVKGDWTRLVMFGCILCCLLFGGCVQFAYFPVLFSLSVSVKQIGCEDRLWNDLDYVGWDVKLYSNLSPKIVQPVPAPGGRGHRRKLCHCPGCKPLCPGRQSVISFCYEARFFRISGNSTILRNNRGQFCRPWHQMAGFTKQIFKNFPGVIPRTPLRDGATHSTPIASTNLLLCAGLKHPSAGTHTIVPSYKLWCPTGDPVRTNSRRRHCFEQDPRGPFTSPRPPSACLLFPLLFPLDTSLSFPSSPLLLEVRTL